MKEFDDIFRDRMNEEQEFSGQKSRWAQVNKNLHAFETGYRTAGKALALWKAVGIVGMLSLVGMFFYMRQVSRENTQLKMLVESLQTVEAQQKSAPFSAEVYQKQAPTIGPESGPATKLENKQPYRDVKKGISNKKASVAVSIPNNTDLAQPGEAAELPLPYPSQAFTVPTPAEKPGYNILFLPENTADIPPDLAVLDSIAAILRLEPDSMGNLPAAKTVEQENTATPIPASDMAKHSYNWRAGLRFTTGAPVPREKGVSLLTGQGLYISYSFWKGLAIAASADYLHYKVDADSVPRYFPKIGNIPMPDPGHHHDKLTNVASSQAIHQYSLGLSYPVRIVNRFQATFSTSHTWSFSPSRLASFRFEDHHGPGPGPHQDVEFMVIDTPKSFASNIWRFGFGLHYELPRWSIGMRGEYNKAGKKTQRALDSSLASAEFLYKF